MSREHKRHPISTKCNHKITISKLLTRKRIKFKIYRSTRKKSKANQEIQIPEG